MIEIILIVIFLCMLISVAFAGGGLGSIAVCIISAGLLVIRIASGKFLHLDKKILVVIHMVCFAMMCFFGLTDGGTDTVHRAGIYDESIKQTMQLIEKEKPEDTYVILEDLEESYGTTEAIVLTRVAALIEEEEYETALEELEKFPDKHAEEYYLAMETIYLGLDTEGEELLKEMYLQAANDCLDWFDMQINAGIVQLENENYRSAEYYFLRAYEIDENNGMALYFQGITQFELREYSKCLTCFAMAYEAGVEDFVIASMQEYMQKIKEEV